MGYEQLMVEFSYSQGEFVKVIGKSCSYVVNIMCLLKLLNLVKDYFVEGLLMVGYVWVLIIVDDFLVLVELIVEKGLMVCDVEKIVQDFEVLVKIKGGKMLIEKLEKDVDIRVLEKCLMDLLGFKVIVGYKVGKEFGDLKIKYILLE